VADDQVPGIDYQAACYYSAPKQSAKYKSLDEVPPEVLETYDKLGIPLNERKALLGSQTSPARPGVAVDAVFDSVSVVTTFKKELAEKGIIFCSFGEAVQNHPELVKKYVGSVVPYSDNFYATLNSAVFHGWVVRLHPQGRALPDGAVALTSASTRRTPASSSARSSSPTKART
jgi:Fe-S cluster assembly protein SufB